MTKTTHPENRPDGAMRSAERKPRRPYRKPEVTYSEVAEVIGATCNQPGGKTNFGSCPRGPINS